jgi:hypothetical protein
LYHWLGNDFGWRLNWLNVIFFEFFFHFLFFFRSYDSINWKLAKTTEATASSTQTTSSSETTNASYATSSTTSS